VNGVDQCVDIRVREGDLFPGQACLIEQHDRVVMPLDGLDLLAHDQKASVGV
jgi:hypothetical protein